jgi:hypothetical protein
VGNSGGPVWKHDAQPTPPQRPVRNFRTPSRAARVLAALRAGPRLDQRASATCLSAPGTAWKRLADKSPLYCISVFNVCSSRISVWA